MEIVTLVLGLALTWAFGWALLHTLDGRSEPGGAAWKWGCGWFVGVFLVTAWMRALSLAGIPFATWSIAGPLAAATAALVLLLVRRGMRAPRSLRDAARAFTLGDGPRWQRVAWAALLAWLAVRFALLLHEVLVQPLYPWDAWTQWSTKARVWFAQRAIAPFLGPQQWLEAASASVYTDAAPHYPATVPLTQAWAALLIGRFDDALANLPWWCNGVALGLALYGALRALRLEPLAALAGTWLVLSLPILDVHVALAGYADLAMASYFTLTALAAFRFVDGRRWQDAALAVVLGVACVTVKNPGKVWILTLLPALLVAFSPRWGMRIAGFGLAALAVLVVALAQTGLTILGYTLQAHFSLSWSALADAYLLFANWHLLGYAVAAVAALAWRNLFAPPVARFSVLAVAGLLFLFFGFAFTTAGAWVEDQSTVNRATLHLAPLLVVWMMVAFREWAAAREPAPVPAPANMPSVAAATAPADAA